MSLLILNNLAFEIVNPHSVELVKAIISMSGGVLSTLLIWYLNKKYEERRNQKQRIKDSFNKIERQYKKK